jgi:tetratricopeptide (TPR) repeat protein
MTTQNRRSAFEQNLASAIQAHQSGQRSQAKAFYDKALKLNPMHAHALYLLSALLFEMGDVALALVYLEKSIAIRSPDIPTRSLMGAVYSRLGRHQEAVVEFKYVVEKGPGSKDAILNLARAQREAGKFGDAIHSFEASIKLSPPTPQILIEYGSAVEASGNKLGALEIYRSCLIQFPAYAEAYLFLCQTLMALGQDAEAEKMLKECLEKSPDNPDAIVQLGVLYNRQSRLREAEIAFRAAINLQPNEAVPQAYLASVLSSAGYVQKAEAFARRAYNLSPNNAEVLTTLGLILQTQGRTEEAMTFQQHAVAANPQFAEAWNNLGYSLQHLNQEAKAIKCYERALDLKPSFFGASTNKAQALLLLGQLSKGWPLYGNRFLQKVLASKHRDFPYREWLPSDKSNTRILLWTDQGLGDEVLYSSMIPDLIKDVSACMLECSARMVPLFQRSFPSIKVVPRKTVPVPAIEAFSPTHQKPLAGLGEIYRPDIESIPKHNGYLQSDPNLTSKLRQKYMALAKGRRIVGISWKSENPNTGRFKSIPIFEWASILSTPNVMFVSLQYSKNKNELIQELGATEREILVDDHVNALENPDDSAAQIAAVDLVVTTSNTTAHIAGALGVPVWTLIPIGLGALWYWFLRRPDSPWYPSMTLFRQDQAGQWSQVLARVHDKLSSWSAS